MKNSPIPEELRRTIYREARDYYARDCSNSEAAAVYKVPGKSCCLGMCSVLNLAMRANYISHYAINAKNFPEYFSYKPKTCWNKSNRFWWTISIKNGGAKKRLEILNRLAEGLSKGE